MAQTKVKLISDGVIVQGNLHASHGITTADIGENASYLYYTDARVSNYLSTNGYDTATNIIASITDSAPSTLDTLNELAAALGDDANFSTTVTNSIATKLPLSGGTMTGDITISSTSPELKFVDTNSFTDTNDRWIVRGGADTLIMRWYDNSASSNTDALTLSSTEAIFTGNITFGDSHFIGDDADDNLLIESSANENIIINSVDDLLLRTGGTTKLIVKNAGNVGIGTSSPNSYSNQTTLTINGTSYGRLDLESGGTLRSSLFSQAANTTLAVSTGFFSIDVGSERLRIDTSGNVGIGVTGPDAKLQIKGTGATSGLTFKTTDSSNNETFYIKDGGVVGVRYYPFKIGVPSGTANVTNTRFQIATTAGDFVVLNDGKTGIGTTTPSNKLDVKISTGNRTTLEPVLTVSAEGSGPYTGFGPKISFNSNIYYGAATGNPAGIIETAYIGAVMGTTYATNSDLVFATRDGATSVTEKMRILGNGNVGIGTTSPGRGLTIDKSNANAALEIIKNNTGNQIVYLGTGSSGGTDDPLLRMYHNTTENIRLYTTGDSWINGGNVGIGTTSPSRPLHIAGASGTAIFEIQRTDTNTTGAVGAIQFNASDDDAVAAISVVGDGDNEGGHLVFRTTSAASDNNYFNSTTERMRITSGGYFKASNSGTIPTSNAHELVSNYNGGQIAQFTHSGSIPYGMQIKYSNASPNTTDNYFFLGTDSTANRIIVWGNGNVQNQNNSYGAISDIKLKENIVDATPKLDDLMKVKIRNYNLIGDDKKQIGVVAQELEEVFPAMIDESIDYEDKEIIDKEGNISTEKVDLGTTTKSVKYSVFIPMLIKSIQELKAEVELLKTQING